MNFILISDAVRITGLDRQTIRNWMDRGIIPYRKISGTFYVDKDTFEALAEQMRDVDGARKKLDELARQYRDEMDSYRAMREDARMRRNTDRYLSVCINAGVRLRFFDTILNLMNTSGILTGTEKAVLSEVLDGDDFYTVAERHGTSRERIRLIAEKAIRRSAELTAVSERISQTDAYQKRITELEEELAMMKRVAYRQAVNEVDANLSDVEKRLFRMDRGELTSILSKRLYDEEISVRALNVLEYYTDDGIRKPIRTVGDLCRISSQDFLQQRNAGKKTLDELTDFLHAYGLDWNLDIDKIIRL